MRNRKLKLIGLGLILGTILSTIIILRKENKNV